MKINPFILKKVILDVDKYDYLIRDSRMLGFNLSFDASRLVDDITVVNNNICYPEHPTRKDFYESAADKLFSKKIKFLSKGSGKIVNGQKIVEFFGFTYKNTIY